MTMHLAGVEISEADFEAAYAEHVAKKKAAKKKAAKKEKTAKPWPQDADVVFGLSSQGNIQETLYREFYNSIILDIELLQGNIFRTRKEAEFERDRRAAEREKRQAENRVLMGVKGA